MILETMPKEVVSQINRLSLKEKGQRLPLYRLHRWWSRRFAYIYRALLLSYVMDDALRLLDYLKDSSRIIFARKLVAGKTFYDPFMGGGTGIIEALILGYNVIGIDINPIPVRIASTTSLLLRGFQVSQSELLKILDEVEDELEFEWKFQGETVSYVFITRNRVPSWITTYGRNGRRIRVLRCPRCGKIFESCDSENTVSCPYCGAEFKVTYKPEYEVSSEDYVEIDGIKYWGLETKRRVEGRIVRRIIPASDRAVRKWIVGSHEKALSMVEEKFDIVKELPVKLKYLSEGRRLLREGIRYAYELFTPRQLATFVKIAEISTSLDVNTKKLVSLALSESAKSCSIIARWYPPLDEPVPALSMKSYWVPEYTVETNPIARIDKTLTPLARSNFVSALRNLDNINGFIRKYGFRIEPSQKINIEIGNSELYKPPSSIDISIMDPPYLDSIKSYASLSLLHYAALALYDRIAGLDKMVDSVWNNRIEDIEQSELPREKEQFSQALSRVLYNTRNKLTKDGKIILLFNKVERDEWLSVHKAAKTSGLVPTAIYWFLGEPPGRLGRSRLRGIFATVYKPGTVSSVDKVNVVFKYPLENIMNEVNLDESIENKAFNSMMSSLKDNFHHLEFIVS